LPPFCALIGSSRNRYVRQVFATAGFWPAASGSKLERLIARITGLLNILCELLLIDGRTTRPLASMLKQTVASP
jgi:hypothetical protein